MNYLSSIISVICLIVDSAVSAGAGEGIIVTSAGMSCNGSEVSFEECSGNLTLAAGDLNCNHIVRDIRINCSGWLRLQSWCYLSFTLPLSLSLFLPAVLSEPFLPVRLNDGRVEIKYGGAWGSVCGNGWGPEEEKVVCQQLGSQGSQSYGEVNWIWTGGVECMGDEERLEDCTMDELGTVNCDPRKLATASCDRKLRSHTHTLPPSLSSTYQVIFLLNLLIGEGSVRLTGGALDNEGRLEVFFDGEWGSVCNRNWGRWSGSVACKDLGYESLVKVTGTSQYNNAENIPIWLNGVQCAKNDRRIRDCAHEPVGYQPCSHDEDVGLICSGKHVHTLQIHIHTLQGERIFLGGFQHKWPQVIYTVS